MSKEIIQKAKIAADRGDFVMASSLLMPLAESGNAEAQFRLGSLYFEGYDIPENEAYRWIKMAADQDHPEACFQWAAFYGTEDGLHHKTDAEQFQLFQRAAELGSVSA